METDIIEYKTCTKCGETQPIELFALVRRCEPKRIAVCKACVKIHNAQHYAANKDALISKRKVFYAANRERIRAEKKTEKKRMKARLYAKKRLDKASAYKRRMMHSNPVYRMRKNLSACVAHVLQRNGGRKNMSFMKKVPYTMDDLRAHLEKQFEPWMNWNNYGLYRTDSWNDNNPATWTWQLDHIIPRSDLPYSSMDDENFQKCWALENLRPLSAKVNVVEGTARVRHANVATIK